MDRPSLDIGDLAEYWTLASSERDLVAGKHRDTRNAAAPACFVSWLSGNYERGLTGPPVTCSLAHPLARHIGGFKPPPQAMRELTSLLAPGTGRR